MLNPHARDIKYIGAFAGCTALVIGAFCVTKSLAQSGQAGPTHAGATARSSNASPIFGVTIPAAYRDWRLVSVAHEEGSLNDIRAILSNDVAIKAYREGKPSFPDGAIIVRLAWKLVASEENNKVFGHAQSFVAGPAPDWYLQVMVKDSKKYSETGGWGFAQFNKDGIPADQAKHETCFPCHVPAKAEDFVFTHYSP